MPNIKDLLILIGQLPQGKMQLEMLDLLFTPEEMAQLQARFAIIEGLFRGQETQRELAARLELSIAKITRGSHALKRISPDLRAYFKELFYE